MERRLRAGHPWRHVHQDQVTGLMFWMKCLTQCIACIGAACDHSAVAHGRFGRACAIRSMAACCALQAPRLRLHHAPSACRSLTPVTRLPACRHRDRGVTMLVRVDVAASAASGVLRCVLSHHPSGFAPYRIDNCSLETLHARQYR